MDKSKKKDAVKKVIAAMTVGKDVSPLFPGAVRCRCCQAAAAAGHIYRCADVVAGTQQGRNTRKSGLP